MPFCPRWFVVEVLPQGERLAIQHLQRQGFRSFCPYFRKVRRHARRVETILAPLFPRYVFVQFDVRRDQWRAINSTTGVRRLVAASPLRPQPMPEAAMRVIFDRCENGVVKSLVPEVVPGDVVRFVSGPFADQLATIDRLDVKGRVRVLLDVLGGVTSVDVGLDCIGPA